MLKKLQFLFELPARLRQCLDMKMYDQAVRYYAKAKNVLWSYREMESFKGRWRLVGTRRCWGLGGVGDWAVLETGQCWRLVETQPWDRDIQRVQ